MNLSSHYSGESYTPLHPGSTLADLSLHDSQIDTEEIGATLAAHFERSPLLPGVLLMAAGECVGLISRRQFLEYLLRPQGLELFLQQPLTVFHAYVRSPLLVLPNETPILMAAQKALRRSPEALGEPIIVRYTDGQHKILDFHELNTAYWQLRGIEAQVWYEKTHLEMLRQTRMASLGRLVDGVSHEILDPVSFIWGNLSHLKDYIRDVMGLIDTYESHLPEIPVAIADYREAIELEYLREDIPRALDSIKTGSDRLSKLATSLQNFCHIDEVYPKPANIHECLEGVLLLLKSRLTSEIMIDRQYGHLPPIPCFIGQLSQVLMNILTQAVNALLYIAVTTEVLAEFTPETAMPAVPGLKPRIQIQTETCSIDGSGQRWIAIRISHNAPTISEELRAQIAKGFTDAKPLTQETELTNSYRIITAKHRGHFRVHCMPDAIALLGSEMTTQFEILLPLN
jgi:hypothetical protein